MAQNGVFWRSVPGQRAHEYATSYLKGDCEGVV